MPINFAVKLAVTVAMEAVQMGLQASQRVRGPRLDETQVTTADYGTPLPRFLGERVFACPIIWAKDLEVVEHTSKVKGGGKHTNESALATFGIAISDCESVGPIEKVLKIWMDETLAYDATGVGPISYAAGLGFDLASVMRIYLGGEDQLPDPAYVEFREAKYGPNSAPAFRGVSTIVFDKLPCDNFGNRVPQIRVLAVTAAEPIYPYEIRTGNIGTIAGFSPDHTTLYTSSGGGFQAWDVATRSLIATSPWGISADNGFADGVVYGWLGPFFDPKMVVLDGHGGGGTVVTFTAWDGAYTGLSYKGGALLAYPINTNEEYAGLVRGTTITKVSCGFSPTHYFEDADTGTWWAVGTNLGDVNLGIYDSRNSHTVINGTRSGAAAGMDNGAGQLLIAQGGYLQLWDKATYSKVSETPISGVFSNQFVAFDCAAPGSAFIWISGVKYDTRTLAVIETVDPNTWVNEGAFQFHLPVYDPINNALVSTTGGTDHLTWRYVDRIANGGVLLGTIISRMCDAAGLTNRDTSLLTQMVSGYSWTRGDVKSQMGPLLDIYDVDARPHDFEIEFRPRGSAPSGTILTQDFAKQDSAPRYKITEAQDTDLPAVIRINFADTAFDQQTNNTLSPLPADAVDSQRDVTIDGTTWASSADNAQQLSDRYIRRQWNSRESIDNSLTPQCLALEPGDVTTLNLDGIVHNAKLTKQTFVGSRMDCTFGRDEPSFAAINAATTGPAMDRTPDTVHISAPVRGFVIDAPLRQDSDSDGRPLLYSGAGTYAGLTYPGAAIYEATGSGSSLAYDQLFATVGTGATWGTCATTLGPVPSPSLWDRGNSVTVLLQAGSLTSVTEADINADPSLNLIIIGRSGAWEYINYATATLNGDGSWTLSDLKRGRRGTEWACSGHQSGEMWVLASSLDVDEMGLDDV
jgi:hypothetical protein